MGALTALVPIGVGRITDRAAPVVVGPSRCSVIQHRSPLSAIPIQTITILFRKS